MIDFPYKKTTLEEGDFSGRRKFVFLFMAACVVILLGRAFDLQVWHKQFLKDQADKNHIDDVSVSAYRGMIRDRNGEPLAISTPVQSVKLNAKLHRELAETQLDKLKKQKKSDQEIAEWLRLYNIDNANKIAQMEKLLGLPAGKVKKMLEDDPNRQFAYLARMINPELAAQVKALKIAGVDFDREFKRFYPTGEIAAHLVGFTDLNDVGQVGLEAEYEQYLKGIPGRKRVIRDGKGQIIDDVESIKEPVSGKDLNLSIDQRIQYLAYRELQIAVDENKAKSAALIVLDAKTGEILAAVNQPSINPNTRKNLKEILYRNRAVTEVFEPGSTVKPFVVASALDGHYVKSTDIFETHGVFKVGNHLVKDVHNYGTLTLTEVLKKSSNVAVSQIALKMPPEYFWGTYNKLGFGSSPNVGFPGEASGSLLDYHRWHIVEQATLAYGYALNASVLQLARAYTALADDGVLHSVSFLKRDEDDDAKRVFTAKTAKQVRAMMETVVSKEGTAYEARVDGYKVAGKTGTVKKAGHGGYSEKRYFSVFAGLAPASDPKLVVVVMVDEPTAGKYYGGLVSAPVFSKVMAGALRVMGVAPDQEDTMPVLLTQRVP
ncbi:MAG: penicillin-binding protein 2 [Methylococcaceae bacterium]|jgi:cell division protein FtsI (penicillin-binding protein 3)